MTKLWNLLQKGAEVMIIIHIFGRMIIFTPFYWDSEIEGGCSIGPFIFFGKMEDENEDSKT